MKRRIEAILAERSRVALLNQLRVPTLVVHGTADPLLPVMHGVHLAAVLPYLQAHHEDSSHWAQIDPVVEHNLL